MTREEARLTLQDNFGYLTNEHPRITEALRVALEVLNEDDSNLDEAVAKYIESQTPADQGEEMIIYNAFKSGAEAITNQRVSLGYLISWYIQSVDGHPPIWTEEHLKELDKDFILIPKPLTNH